MRRAAWIAGVVPLLASCGAILGLPDPALDPSFDPPVDAAIDPTMEAPDGDVCDADLCVDYEKVPEAAWDTSDRDELAGSISVAPHPPRPGAPQGKALRVSLAPSMTQLDGRRTREYRTDDAFDMRVDVDVLVPAVPAWGDRFTLMIVFFGAQNSSIRVQSTVGVRRASPDEGEFYGYSQTTPAAGSGTFHPGARFRLGEWHHVTLEPRIVGAGPGSVKLVIDGTDLGTMALARTMPSEPATLVGLGLGRYPPNTSTPGTEAWFDDLQVRRLFR